MGTIKIYIGLVCLAIAGSGWGIDSGIVATLSSRTAGRELLAKHASTDVSYRRHDDKLFTEINKEKYERIIRIATKEIGVVERTNKNDGERIAEYLRYCNIGTPAPYCAAFLSFVFGQAGLKQPRTAWSPALFPVSRLVKEPKPGIVYGIYFAKLGRIGHCGITESLRHSWLTGIEGNTNVAGSRDGDGVYRRIRHTRTIARYADWLK